MSTISFYSVPYISIAPQIDIQTTTPITPDLLRGVTESPDRSRVPNEFLEQLREFDAPNNRLLQFLRPVEDAENALELSSSELQELKTLADQALALSRQNSTGPTGPTINPATSLPPIVARTSTRIEESTLVDGAVPGARISISSDNGEDFVFTFGANPTSWGEVLAELNAAEIGVKGRIDRSNPAEPRLVLESADGKTGFRINGSSSQQVVDDLVGITSSYDGEYAAAKFVDGAAMPRLVNGRGPSGLTFGAGGSLLSTGTDSVIAAGSSLRFSGSDGIVRNWTASATSSVRQFALDINAMRGSVVADVTADGRLRLRDTQGGAVSIGRATGSFEAQSGAMRLAADVAPPPQPGLDPKSIAARPTSYIERETVVSGAGNGMRLSLTTDSGQNFTFTFGMSASTTSWGEVADALDAANIGLKMRFDENLIGSPRMTLYSTDGKSGFRIDGTSSRQVVDDLFGIVSPYDGAFSAQKFADGANRPVVGLAAKEQGMTFGIGASYQSRGIAGPISVGSSISFIDSDGITRSWRASGSNTSPLAFMQEIRGFGSNVMAEYTSEQKIRLRSTDGTELRILSATGDFDPALGSMSMVAHVAAPVEPAPRSTSEQIASIGRILNYRMTQISGRMSQVAYTYGLDAEAVTQISSNLDSTRPSLGWGSNQGSIEATRAAIVEAIPQTDNMIALMNDRLALLRRMENDYRELGSDLKNFAVEMLDSYLTWDSAKSMASQIQSKLADKTSSLSPDQARDLLLLLG
ncbi:MAG: hypothetical protein ACRDBL_14985 [Rhabdaerophilum sp.]